MNPERFIPQDQAKVILGLVEDIRDFRVNPAGHHAANEGTHYIRMSENLAEERGISVAEARYLVDQAWIDAEIQPD